MASCASCGRGRRLRLREVSRALISVVLWPCHSQCTGKLRVSVLQEANDEAMLSVNTRGRNGRAHARQMSIWSEQLMQLGWLSYKMGALPKPPSGVGPWLPSPCSSRHCPVRSDSQLTPALRRTARPGTVITPRHSVCVDMDVGAAELAAQSGQAALRKMSCRLALRPFETFEETGPRARRGRSDVQDSRHQTRGSHRLRSIGRARPTCSSTCSSIAIHRVATTGRSEIGTPPLQLPMQGWGTRYEVDATHHRTGV